MEETSEIASVQKTSGYLLKAEVEELMDNESLILRPLLEASQINEIGIDFRLGYDFLVSIQGREAFINASKNNWDDSGNRKNVHHFFQNTRRQVGETFILHPHQTVLAVSLEYVKLPPDCILKLYMRSSYSRLGITINTLAQPGYCGCLSIELTNNNNNPINLTVGARIMQGLIYRIDNGADYFKKERKYVCQVRPEPSSVIMDTDLDKLNSLWKSANNRD